MKYLGIDWGEKRLGLALSDDDHSFAFEYQVLEYWNTEDFFEYMRKLIGQEHIERIVIGLPTNMQGEDTEVTEEVREFASTLENCLDIPIEFEDERFTTKMVDKVLREMRISQREARHRKDMVAAKYLLQSYLDRERLE